MSRVMICPRVLSSEKSGAGVPREGIFNEDAAWAGCAKLVVVMVVMAAAVAEKNARLAILLRLTLLLEVFMLSGIFCCNVLPSITLAEGDARGRFTAAAGVELVE